MAISGAKDCAGLSPCGARNRCIGSAIWPTGTPAGPPVAVGGVGVNAPAKAALSTIARSAAVVLDCCGVAAAVWTALTLEKGELASCPAPSSESKSDEEDSRLRRCAG